MLGGFTHWYLFIFYIVPGTVYCLPSEDAGVTDRFCMPYGLAAGDACGATAAKVSSMKYFIERNVTIFDFDAQGYLGYCGTGMGCIGTP